MAFAILHLLEQKPGRFFYHDVLGYVMLCLSTVFMAAALAPGTEKQLRTLLLVHGAVAIPTYLLPYLPVSFAPSESGTQSGSGVRILVGDLAELFTTDDSVPDIH